MGSKTGDYLIEFIQNGAYMKVSVIDPVSGREVSIVGPAAAPREHLIRVAVKKMEYVLTKEKT
ncbi:MAG: hypothetical protein K9G26_07355 [Emcibacter sp.]|nr:hypothetical protein [Emcibacter sp.]